jgi:hypothetical protein
MSQSLRISLWNANGLVNHNQEVKLFISTHKLDIMLISETHFTDFNWFKIPNFTVYCTNHPDNTAHGGSAIIIRNTIKHFILPNYQYDHLQATSIVVEDWMGPLTVSALYCPPRHNIADHQFLEYFNTLGPRFLAGGDYNAKHNMWGSRINSPRGRQLYKCISNNHMSFVSTGEPTYWPTDRQKIPDLLDFFIVKGVSNNYLNVESSLDLHSDHSPIILTVSSTVILKEHPPILCNKFTNWDLFRKLFDQNVKLNISLKSPDEIDQAVELFNLSIQNAAWKATPNMQAKSGTQNINYPMYIKRKIADKRRLRRVWQNTRNPLDKTNLNRAAQQLKRALHKLKNEWFCEFSSSLAPTEASNYSLWKVTKSVKQPQTHIPPILKSDGSWAKSDKEKSEEFSKYFQDVFKPFYQNLPISDHIIEYLDSPQQLSLPIIPFKPSELKNVVISELKDKKAPGYDLITNKILKELSRKGFIFLNLIFNAVLRTQYFPSQWKVAQIVLVPKPGKPPHQVSSYRPISLLPATSKVFEKLFLKRLLPVINASTLIPPHQFGFRHNHSTIEQIHRIVNVIDQTLQNKKYCSAAFLDVTQAFDKVWHPGLLFKLKSSLPNTYFNIIQSYLSERYFRIKFKESYSELCHIESGVPQGSVLGPILYVLYTADLPVLPEVTVATFADDTALLATHTDPVVATNILQRNLNDLSAWLNEWRMKVNETKSSHVTFTLNSNSCPPVSLNNVIVPQVQEVKYLGMFLDRRLTWQSHIWHKRQQLNFKFNQLSWLLTSKSHLSVQNKLLIYKVVLKPIWTYGIQLWGTSSSSNIEILQRFQSKTLRKLLSAPWYVSNKIIHEDTKIPFIRDEISKFSSKYLGKLETHENYLAVNLLDNSLHRNRLNRYNVLNLSTRFN